MAIKKIGGGGYQEILEIRSRLPQIRWDTMIVDVRMRLLALHELLESCDNREVFRHVTVAAIAALETFQRGAFMAIADASQEHKARVANAVPEKISLKDAVAWLEGGEITGGELVAHSLPFSCVKDLLY
ncbi:MAG: hypothetical protein KGS28_16710 [Betaproteobacteria bacterium]|nr:hypothetical protein [Betaproteobacteria bacterium]